MTTDFRPLLAATVEDVKHIRLPVVASPKLDGIRCIMLAGKAHSRNIKPIRNRYVQSILKGLPDGIDGELIVGQPYGELVFNRTTSGVMSADGEPDFVFYVFDNVYAPGGFSERLKTLFTYEDRHRCVEVVQHVGIHTLKALNEYEQKVLEQGYEGVMLRKPGGSYKFGRSTMNEQILMKLKRFRDGEAIITGFEEGVHNLNEATTDALGLTVRSSHKDNMVGSGRIGTLLGIDCVTGKDIVISPGRMTQAERIHYFNNRSEIFNRIAKYKVFDYGTVDVPRFCTFQGFRDKDDMHG